MSRKLTGLALALALIGAAACGNDGSDGSVLPGVSALVFVKRAFITGDGAHDVGAMMQTIDYDRYVPGGGVFVLEPPTPDGTLRELTADFDGVDINGLDVSFDGLEVTFAMRHAGDSHYHIYVAAIDGSYVRQLTFGDYDDTQSVYGPGGRIFFATNQPYTAMGTRANEYTHSRNVSQIGSVSVAGGDADRIVCSQNLSNHASPFVLADGRIGFSRWEHLGPVNDVKVFAMNPDCSQMTAVGGQHGKPGNSLVQIREIERGVYVGITTTREGTVQAGSLIKMDTRATSSVGDIAINEQFATFEMLTPAVPTGMESPPSGVGRYRRPIPMGNGQYLVSWSDGDVNERNELAGTAPDFGIYLFDESTRERTLIYNDAEMWDLYALPVQRRDVPPVIESQVDGSYSPDVPARLGSVDVTVTSLEENIGAYGEGGFLDGQTLSDALGEAVKVRIIEGFSSEIGGVNMFGLTMHEGGAIVGEAQVQADGSWEAQVPSYLPYHLQPIDKFGLAIRNQLLWIQAMPGEERRCGGCHENRAQSILPRSGPTTLAQQAFDASNPAFNFNISIPERTELPWAGAASNAGTPHTNMQDLFNAKCVSCHSGGAGDPFAGMSYMIAVTTEEGEMLNYTIPYLDLSDRPLEVYYEMEMVQYPASYVTMLYPSAMMGDVVATGTMPPMWVVPGSARESAAIAAVNAVSEDGTETAWPTALHPEDVGVTLTREERLMLIRMADLGGQFFSRRNVDSAAMYY